MNLAANMLARTPRVARLRTAVSQYRGVGVVQRHESAHARRSCIVHRWEHAVIRRSDVRALATGSLDATHASKAKIAPSEARTPVPLAGSELQQRVRELCRRRGFVYPGSSIYGGLAGSFDYGPLGVHLKKAIVNAWWNDFVVTRRDVHGLDASIIMNPEVWRAAGHVENFTDPVVECGGCGARHRADKLVDGHVEELPALQQPKARELVEELRAAVDKELSGESQSSIAPDGAHIDAVCLALERAIAALKIKCPTCKALALGRVHLFNMLLQTSVGTGAAGVSTFLRPETAQGIFTNFAHVVLSMRPQLPFGIGQVGKAFRNEISPSNFLFRTREFEQMELEYFCQPEEAPMRHKQWIDDCFQWLLNLGLKKSSLEIQQSEADDLAHYSVAGADIRFRFPFGWDELWGIAHRGDYDLRQHHTANSTRQSMRYVDPTYGSAGRQSKKDPSKKSRGSGPRDMGEEDELLEEFDQDGQRRILFPHVIEPAIGVDRLFYAVLCDAYTEELVPSSKGPLPRTVLKLRHDLAPYRFAVLPLSNKPGLAEMAAEVRDRLLQPAAGQAVVLQDVDLGDMSLSAQMSPTERSSSFGVDLDHTGSVGKRYRRQDEIGTPYCITVDFRSLEDQTVTLRFRDCMTQVRLRVDDLVSVRSRILSPAVTATHEQPL